MYVYGYFFKVKKVINGQFYIFLQQMTFYHLLRNAEVNIANNGSFTRTLFCLKLRQSLFKSYFIIKQMFAAASCVWQ